MRFKKLCCYMPCYNAEKYVEKTIKNILNQTYRDFDLIICNDGSTDNSVSIINSIAREDSRVKLYHNDFNMGLGYTSNRMFELCKGYEYVALMDADDLAPENRFAIEMDFLEHNRDISCVAGILQIIDKDDNLGVIMDHGIRKSEDVKKALLFYDVIPNSSAMLRMKDLFDNNIRYNTNFKYAQDYLFYCDLSQKCKIQILPYILEYYRIHEDSISNCMLKEKRHIRDGYLDKIHKRNFKKNKVKGLYITKKILIRGFRDTPRKSLLFRFIFLLVKRGYGLIHREYMKILK